MEAAGSSKTTSLSEHLQNVFAEGRTLDLSGRSETQLHAALSKNASLIGAMAKFAPSNNHKYLNITCAILAELGRRSPSLKFDPSDTETPDRMNNTWETLMESLEGLIGNADMAFLIQDVLALHPSPEAMAEILRGEYGTRAESFQRILATLESMKLEIYVLANLNQPDDYIKIRLMRDSNYLNKLAAFKENISTELKGKLVALKSDDDEVTAHINRREYLMSTLRENFKEFTTKLTSGPFKNLDEVENALHFVTGILEGINRVDHSDVNADPSGIWNEAHVNFNTALLDLQRVRDAFLSGGMAVAIIEE